MSCFHFFTDLKNAVMDIHAQVFVGTYVFILLGVELLNHVVSLCAQFRGTTKLCLKVTALFYTLSSNVWALQFSYSFINAYYCLFYFSHLSGCDVSYCLLICIYLMTNDIEYLFMCLFFREMLTKILWVFLS